MVLNRFFFPEPPRPAAQQLSETWQAAGFEVSICAEALASAPRAVCPLSITWHAGDDAYAVMECSLENPWLTAAIEHTAHGGLLPHFPTMGR